MHLTNYSINKHNENFEKDDSSNNGSKRYVSLQCANTACIVTLLLIRAFFVTPLFVRASFVTFLLIQASFVILLFIRASFATLLLMWGSTFKLQLQIDIFFLRSSKQDAHDMWYVCGEVSVIFIHNYLLFMCRTIKYLKEWLQTMEYDVTSIWRSITVSYWLVHYDVTLF